MDDEGGWLVPTACVSAVEQVIVDLNRGNIVYGPPVRIEFIDSDPPHIVATNEASSKDKPQCSST